MPTTDSRRLDPTPLFAVVGVTDLAVARVRTAVATATAAQLEAQKQAQKAISEFHPKATAQEVPTRAVAAALEAASKAEARYEDLARRGKDLVERVRSQRSTQDLLNQAGNTISRTRGAVTTARKATNDTATVVRGTLNVGRREAVGTAEASAERVQEATQTIEKAAKQSGGRARKNAAATRSAAKGVRTSASKTASTAGKAAKDTAEKVGE